MRTKFRDGSVLEVTFPDSGPALRAFRPKPTDGQEEVFTPLDDGSWECEYCHKFNETGVGDTCGGCNRVFNPNPHDELELDGYIQEDVPEVPPGPEPHDWTVTGRSRAALLMAAAQDVFSYMNRLSDADVRDQRFVVMTDVMVRLGLIVDEVQALLGLTDSQAAEALKRGITDLLLVHLQPGIDSGGGDDGDGDGGVGDGGDGDDGGGDDVKHRDQRARLA